MHYPCSLGPLLSNLAPRRRGGVCGRFSNQGNFRNLFMKFWGNICEISLSKYVSPLSLSEKYSYLGGIHGRFEIIVKIPSPFQFCCFAFPSIVQRFRFSLKIPNSIKRCSSVKLESVEAYSFQQNCQFYEFVMVNIFFRFFYLWILGEIRRVFSGFFRKDFFSIVSENYKIRNLIFDRNRRKWKYEEFG